MQSYVILKQPGKAVFYLLTIMILLVVRDTYGAGPIEMVRYFHSHSSGNLHVNDEGHVATTDSPVTLYQISVGQNFTLYDPVARMFICWIETWIVKKEYCKPILVLEARKYTEQLNMKDCLFSDEPLPEEKFPGGYVSLLHRKSKHRKLKLKLNKDGAFMKNCRKYKIRHEEEKEKKNKKKKKCLSKVDRCNSRQAIFLEFPEKSDSPCPRAEEFCRTELSKMPELRQCCKDFIRSNETTD